MRCVEHINPAILRWARTTAGLSEEEAARKIGLGSSAKATAVEKLAALEDGRNFPTHGQLSRIAIAYRRPRAVFYRSAPPLPADGKEGFRTLVEHSVPRGDAALLAALIRDIRARQDMVRSIIEDDEDVEPRSFIGSASITDAVPGVAGRLRKLLGFDEDEEIFRGTGSPNDLFSRLRERVEDIGVFVILAGNLGSFHSNIDERVFRGFAIADPIAPFIVINDQDAKSAWSFTLIHELTHIFVGSSGVSFPPNASMSRKGIEHFCNNVAGEFLLPKRFLPKGMAIARYSNAKEIIRKVAEHNRLSESMVAHRLWQIDRISDETYRNLSEAYADRWRFVRKHRRAESRNGGGDPSYYTVRRHRLGKTLISLVRRTLRANELTYTKAAKILGVKAGSVEPLLGDRKIVGVAFSSGKRRLGT